MDNYAARFLASAALHPGRIALVHGDATVTYAELAARMRAFASHLHDAGVSPGDRVALFVRDSWEFVVAFYGALAAGAIAVPFTMAGRTAEYRAPLAHAEPRCVVLDGGNAEAVRALATLERAPHVVRVDEVRDSITFAGACSGPGSLEPLPVDRDAAAAITYTSGTTGRPKGVTLSHGNLAANYGAIVEYLRLGCEDSIVTVLPFCHSYGASVLHTHLLVGGRVIVEDGLVYPHAVVGRLASERATGFAGVPPTYALLLSRVRLEDFDLRGLRYLTQAGGPMAPALVRRVRESLPHAALYVMYGQTEATARLAYLPPADALRKEGSVGIPVQGVAFEIRDDAGQALPRGATGQLWVRGPNVMLGYWRDPEATAGVLRDGWLNTGDLGRVDDDGYLYIVGRRSDIIKAGAYRVHPGEIEAAIAELPFVAEVAVAGVDDALLGQVVKAWIVGRPGATVDAMRVRQHCRERLAAYKVPKHVEAVAALPRTSSGKIRRVALATRAGE